MKTEGGGSWWFWQCPNMITFFYRMASLTNLANPHWNPNVCECSNRVSCYSAVTECSGWSPVVMVLSSAHFWWFEYSPKSWTVCFILEIIMVSQHLNIYMSELFYWFFSACLRARAWICLKRFNLTNIFASNVINVPLHIFYYQEINGKTSIYCFVNPERLGWMHVF